MVHRVWILTFPFTFPTRATRGFPSPLVWTDKSKRRISVSFDATYHLRVTMVPVAVMI